jgi:hypothetical protein
MKVEILEKEMQLLYKYACAAANNELDVSFDEFKTLMIDSIKLTAESDPEGAEQAYKKLKHTIKLAEMADKMRH